MLLSAPTQLGYGALFGFVFAESAGVPLPGETALIAAGLLTRGGHLSLAIVIAVAATAAMLGDNLGFFMGRRGGRRLLERSGWMAGRRRRALAHGDAFFARHGAKTVFFGRWVTGVRIVAAVLAGASHMPWRTFAVYNALGAVAWSATVAGVAAFTGPAGAAVIYAAGLVAAGGGAAFAAGRSWLGRRRGGTASPAQLDGA
jgi:membrane protein DedA with SNARE-associated domain